MVIVDGYHYMQIARPSGLYQLPPQLCLLPPRQYERPPRLYQLPPRLYHLPPQLCLLPSQLNQLSPQLHEVPPQLYLLPQHPHHHHLLIVLRPRQSKQPMVRVIRLDLKVFELDYERPKPHERKRLFLNKRAFLITKIHWIGLTRGIEKMTLEMQSKIDGFEHSVRAAFWAPTRSKRRKISKQYFQIRSSFPNVPRKEWPLRAAIDLDGDLGSLASTCKYYAQGYCEI